MIQLEHKKRIVDACFPETYASANEYWHDIKPVKFGEAQFLATNIELASYQVPEDAAYMLILRVECYTFIPGLTSFFPPPQGVARWAYTDVEPFTPQYRLTPDLPIHQYTDSDEFLFAKGDHRVSLVALLNTTPNFASYVVRTLVYGYLLGALVADRLGASESTYFAGGPFDFPQGGPPPAPPVRPPIPAPPAGRTLPLVE